LLSEHEFQHETVRRPPTTPTRLSAGTVTVTTGCPERRIKGWPSFVHIPSSQSRILSSPLLSPLPSSIFTLHRGPGQLPVTALTRRPHGGVDFGRCTIITTIRTVHFVAFPPLDPAPDPVLAHHARPCFYTQVSHITAEGCLCVSRGGWGKKKRGGCR
jgi:hypothetical protein